MSDEVESQKLPKWVKNSGWAAVAFFILIAIHVVIGTSGTLNIGAMHGLQTGGTTVR